MWRWRTHIHARHIVRSLYLGSCTHAEESISELAILANRSGGECSAEETAGSSPGSHPAQLPQLATRIRAHKRGDSFGPERFEPRDIR